VAGRTLRLRGTQELARPAIAIVWHEGRYSID